MILYFYPFANTLIKGYNKVSMEKNYCTKCGECCKKIAVDFSQNIIYRDGIQPLTPGFSSMLEPVEKRENVTFCKCKYLKNNLCTNTNKPDICINYPSSPFAFIPDNCGFYGEVFLNREKFMQKLRKLEEEIIHYEALIEVSSKDDAKQYSKIIENHRKYLNKYKIYY